LKKKDLRPRDLDAKWTPECDAGPFGLRLDRVCDLGVTVC
jgi:hypothetical protein